MNAILHSVKDPATHELVGEVYQIGDIYTAHVRRTWADSGGFSHEPAVRFGDLRAAMGHIKAEVYRRQTRLDLIWRHIKAGTYGTRGIRPERIFRDDFEEAMAVPDRIAMDLRTYGRARPGDIWFEL